MRSPSERVLETPPPAPDARLAYGADPLQLAELHLPPGAGPHPVVAFVHGGYWRARYDLSYAGHACAALARAGLATLNVEYRRVGNPGGGWPGSRDDVLAAVRAIPDWARGRPLDASRIVVAGHSAGAELAMCVAAHEPSLAGVVSLAGVLDLRRAWELGLSEGAVAAFLGGAPDARPAEYAAASPIELAIPRVPQRLLHGDADEDVPVELSVRHRDAKAARGEDVSLRILPGAGHFELVDPDSAEWPAVVATLCELAVAPR